MMHTLLPLTESTNPRGGECKQSRDSYVMLIPMQKAQIAKYALASGKKAAILLRLRYTKEFCEHAESKICIRIEALRKK